MGAFSEIFGKVPRVLILEMFSEEPDDELTVKDIIEQTGISKRGAYLIIRKFLNEGLLVESGIRPKKYMLNYNDLRARTLINAEPLLIMGKLEYELKVDKNIPVNMPYQDTCTYINSEDIMIENKKSGENTLDLEENIDNPLPVGA